MLTYGLEWRLGKTWGDSLSKRVEEILKRFQAKKRLEEIFYKLYETET